jgi:hypothetical protein
MATAEGCGTLETIRRSGLSKLGAWNMVLFCRVDHAGEELVRQLLLDGSGTGAACRPFTLTSTPQSRQGASPLHGKVDIAPAGFLARKFRRWTANDAAVKLEKKG